MDNVPLATLGGLAALKPNHILTVAFMSRPYDKKPLSSSTAKLVCLKPTLLLDGQPDKHAIKSPSDKTIFTNTRCSVRTTTDICFEPITVQAKDRGTIHRSSSLSCTNVGAFVSLNFPLCTIIYAQLTPSSSLDLLAFSQISHRFIVSNLQLITFQAL
ncbi:hypothetical protein L2E82_35965 [Cichorium intybus]|uniref:Uncharacterized protein n=1 Tax=Cichorium intybus TaxID=13427 RepID=A0ACB9BQD0_CICIN|nr:hypothetical protein L2E82_35965 [Cichorium intybus]